MLITNGKDEKNVTRGAYEQFYKPLGYKPIVVIETNTIEKSNKIEKKEELVSQNKTPKKSKK